MLGHEKFGQKMEQAIAALLSHRSVDEAARVVGVSANTLSRWMKQPEFEVALREARRTISAQAFGRLQDAAGAAATTVLKIMVDSNVPPGTRLRAAEIVLERAADADQIENLEDRVAKLERMAGLANNSLQRSPDLSFLKSLPGPDTAQLQIAGLPTDTVEPGESDVE
jgi:transposase-like protein